MKALLKYQADGEEGNNKSLEEENTLSFIKSRLWYVSVVEFSFESFRLQKFINFFKYLNPRNRFSLYIPVTGRFENFEKFKSKVIIAESFYNVKYGSSIITSESLSENLSIENKHWCFCCLQDKT